MKKTKQHYMVQIWILTLCFITGCHAACRDGGEIPAFYTKDCDTWPNGSSSEFQSVGRNSRCIIDGLNSVIIHREDTSSKGECSAVIVLLVYLGINTNAECATTRQEDEMPEIKIVNKYGENYWKDDCIELSSVGLPGRYIQYSIGSQLVRPILFLIMAGVLLQYA